MNFSGVMILNVFRKIICFDIQGKAYRAFEPFLFVMINPEMNTIIPEYTLDYLLAVTASILDP